MYLKITNKSCNFLLRHEAELFLGQLRFIVLNKTHPSYRDTDNTLLSSYFLFAPWLFALHRMISEEIGGAN